MSSNWLRPITDEDRRLLAAAQDLCTLRWDARLGRRRPALRRRDVRWVGELALRVQVTGGIGAAASERLRQLIIDHLDDHLDTGLASLARAGLPGSRHWSPDDQVLARALAEAALPRFSPRLRRRVSDFNRADARFVAAIAARSHDPEDHITAAEASRLRELALRHPLLLGREAREIARGRR